jgi:hypothetical protein
LVEKEMRVENKFFEKIIKGIQKYETFYKTLIILPTIILLIIIFLLIIFVKKYKN